MYEIIPTDIKKPIVGLKDTYENVEFETLTCGIGMLLVVELEPQPNMNRGGMVDDVEVPVVDVLNGWKNDLRMFFQNEKAISANVLWK